MPFGFTDSGADATEEIIADSRPSKKIPKRFVKKTFPLGQEGYHGDVALSCWGAGVGGDGVEVGITE